MDEAIGSSRRTFIGQVGSLASGAALAASVPAVARASSGVPPHILAREEWDLSWLDRLASGTDRAVFDWPSLGDPADAIVLQMASRYIENCAAAYRPGTYQVRVVLNIRTTAVPSALNDAMWERYQLGAEYGTKDPTTQQPALRNPFMYRAPSPVAGIVLPNLADLRDAGAIVLVCDFALGNLAKRLAAKTNTATEDVHRTLRSGFLPGAFAVPSGIFGLARAQNAGCALVRL